ncbi:MAG: hypothetical protein QOK04_2028, partial [Solirubrobacteraceae bacterium]|nr:hypothetical protein [Solirubrobacteraceae bacterium]
TLIVNLIARYFVVRGERGKRPAKNAPAPGMAG